MKRLLLIFLLAACADEPPVPVCPEGKPSCPVDSPAPKLCIVTNLEKSGAGSFSYCMQREGPTMVMIDERLTIATRFSAAALGINLFGENVNYELKWPFDYESERDLDRDRL